MESGNFGAAGDQDYTLRIENESYMLWLARYGFLDHSSPRDADISMFSSLANAQAGISFLAVNYRLTVANCYYQLLY